jgi:hypothetical protein
VGAGVTKIRLTGGEPTVRRDIVPLTRDLSRLPGLQTLAMTSNGLVLERMLPELQLAGAGRGGALRLRLRLRCPQPAAAPAAPNGPPYLPTTDHRVGPAPTQ